jgi:hypothetical protein
MLTKVGKASEYEPTGSNFVLASSGHVFDNEEISLKIVISDKRSVVMEGLCYIFLFPSARTVNSQGVPTIGARRFNDCTSLCSIMHVLEFAFFLPSAWCIRYAKLKTKLVTCARGIVRPAMYSFKKMFLLGAGVHMLCTVTVFD